MKKALVCPLLVFGNYFSLNAQKTEEINPSGYTHNYVVGNLKYIEDLKDTARLRYIVTIRVSGAQEEMPALGLIQIKAKQLGADCYYMTNALLTETSGEITLRLFFGGERFIENNKTKQISNQVFIFNQTRKGNDTAAFYLNGQPQSFLFKNHYHMHAELNREIVIGVNQDKITTSRLIFKKPKPARFFILPDNKKTIVMGGQPGAMPSLSVSGIPISIRKNKFYEMSYDYGRLFSELYR